MPLEGVVVAVASAVVGVAAPGLQTWGSAWAFGEGEVVGIVGVQGTVRGESVVLGW